MLTKYDTNLAVLMGLLADRVEALMNSEVQPLPAEQLFMQDGQICYTTPGGTRLMLVNRNHQPDKG